MLSDVRARDLWNDQPYSNDRTVCPLTHTYTVLIKMILKCCCRALSTGVNIVILALRNHFGEKRSEVQLLRCLCILCKSELRESGRRLVCSRQCGWLFTPTKLFSKRNAWRVFCWDHATKIFDNSSRAFELWL